MKTKSNMNMKKVFCEIWSDVRVIILQNLTFHHGYRDKTLLGFLVTFYVSKTLYLDVKGTKLCYMYRLLRQGFHKYFVFFLIVCIILYDFF